MIVLSEPVSVAIVIVPGSSTSGAFAAIDLFGSAGRHWQLPDAGGRRLFEPYLVAERTTEVIAPDSVRVQRLDPFQTDRIPKIIYVPEIVMTGELRAPLWSGLHEWLRHCHSQGSILASASTGAALFADANLLTHQTAATHWALVPTLQRLYPGVTFSSAESVCSGDDAATILTAGAGQAWTDLVVSLIARFTDKETALQSVRVNLLQWHEFGQRPYREPLSSPANNDEAIASAIRWLNQNFTQPAPISLAVEQAGIPERTFTRRFHVATGASPLEYVHQLRLNKARRLLESGGLSIQVVAQKLGYEDPSFFSRLFKREVGLTPAQYRKRFSPLYDALPTGPGQDHQA